MKRYLWILAVGLVTLLACTQPPPKNDAEHTGSVSQDLTGSYQQTPAWTNAGFCTVCGSATYACFSLHQLTSLTFADVTPAGGVVTNVSVVLNGVFTTTSLGTTINGTAIGAAQNVDTNLNCGGCASPTFTLANGSGIPGWVYRGTNTLAVQVGNNDACIDDAVIAVTYVYRGTTVTTVVSGANPSVFGQAVTFTSTVVPSPAGTATGTVTFSDGATPLGTATLNGSDQAFLSVATLSIGAHTIAATYNGDTNYQASSGTVGQTVNKAATSTTLSSSVNPSTVAENVTFTATVAASSPATGVPGGTVTFFDGATNIGSGVLNGSGVATFSTAGFAVGSHTVSAAYGGSTFYNASTSPGVTQVVSQDATTVGLTSSLNPSTFGASVVFTATVTTQTSGGTPTGTVTFSSGATPLGTVALNGAGVATLTTAALTGGTHTIAAAYSGDANHQVAAASINQVVNLGASTTSLTSATNPSVFGQSVQFTATVSGAGGGPTGTVTFLDGGSALATVSLNGGSQANLTISTLSAATHAITAHYTGDLNFAASTSSALSQLVGQAATTTTLSSSGNPSVVGSQVVFTAAVAAVGPGAGTPTGTVTFLDGSTSIGSGVINGSGVATLATTGLAVGTHGITGVYSGDTGFATSTSGALSQTVTVDGITAALTSSLNPSTYGTNVTFTATVVTSSTGGTPSGTVTFSDGGAAIGSATLDNTGVALFATAKLLGRTHTITAIYAGDADHAGGSSGAVVQVVDVAATTTQVLASANPSVFGQSVTISGTVTSAAAGPVPPTGSVVFSDGATMLGGATLNLGGAATLTTSHLIVGDHMLVAAYSGDSNYGPSTSMALDDTVKQAATTTALTSSSNPSLIGTAVTFSAAITATAPGNGTPTGTVTFSDGTTALGTGTANTMGIATFTTSALTSGLHSITAAYGGDSSFVASDSVPLAQTVAVDSATLKITALPSPSSFGMSETFTATMTGSAGTPTGTVTFTNGATTLGSSVLNGSGVATLATAMLGAGTVTITATYGGDPTYTTATGSVTLLVAKAVTTSTLTSAVNPATLGQSVTFTATVASTVAGCTGSVEFSDGSTSLGMVPLAGATATLSTSALSIGGHTITVVYSGDSNFAGSTSSALGETVRTGAAGDAGAADGGQGGADAGNAAGGDSGASGGCSCRVESAGPSAGFSLLGVLGLGALFTIRRRR